MDWWTAMRVAHVIASSRASRWNWRLYAWGKAVRQCPSGGVQLPTLFGIAVPRWFVKHDCTSLVATGRMPPAYMS